MRFAFIAAERAQHSATLLCRCLRVTRTGFYACATRGPSARAQRDVVLRTTLRAFHAASGHLYGHPTLWKDLREDGERVSEKRAARLMHDGLEGRVWRRYRASTALGIACSMSRRADCDVNAVMEAFFSTVKREEAARFPELRRREDRAVRLHRGVPQPAPTALDSRPDQPGRIRAPGAPPRQSSIGRRSGGGCLRSSSLRSTDHSRPQEWHLASMTIRPSLA
jgi:hypothetical protein